MELKLTRFADWFILDVKVITANGKNDYTWTEQMKGVTEKDFRLEMKKRNPYFIGF